MQIKLNQPSQQAIRIVQLSDSHLGENDQVRLLGMNTDNSLDHVLDMLQQQADSIDLILVTGDIALHGAFEAYQRFQSKLSGFEQPVVWLAGNHDNATHMRELVAASSEMSRSVLIGDWQLVLLDSVVPGEVGGHLAESELNFLRHCLEQYPDKPTVIALHHHPLDIGCNWLDQQRVSNAEEFLVLINDHSNVKLVCFGHVHQDFDHVENGVRFIASPSTCVQFAPNSAEFKLDPKAPGARLLELHGTGEVNTEVWRLQGVELEVDIESSGYAQEDR